MEWVILCLGVIQDPLGDIVYPLSPSVGIVHVRKADIVRADDRVPSIGIYALL